MTSDRRRSEGDPWVRRALVVGALCLPFLFGILATRGLRDGFHTFHDSDEAVYHYPTIVEFSSELPRPDLTTYQSATTPLYHLVMAVGRRVLDLSLPGLRLLNVVVSFAAVLAVFALLAHRLGWSRRSAVLLALVFEMAPYFYGVSFILLTDNFALLWVTASLYCALGESTFDGVKSNLLTGLAALTRQGHIWLYAPAAMRHLLAVRSPAARAAFVASAIVAALPLVALAWLWGGLVPPGFDRHVTAPSLRGAIFLVAVLGLFTVAIRPSLLWPLWSERPRRARAALCLAAAVLLLLASPVGARAVDDGYLWRIARHLPSVAGTSLVFWILVPIGICALVEAAREERWRRDLIWSSTVPFAAIMVLSGFLYQKYFDPIALILVFAFGPARGDRARRIDTAAAIATLCAFTLYSLSPVRVALIDLLS